MNNADVIRAWNFGQPGATKNLMTDGDRLWSYRLLIGYTDDDQLVAIDYTSRAGQFHSTTTSKHVGMASRIASRTIHPDEV